MYHYNVSFKDPKNAENILTGKVALEFVHNGNTMLLLHVGTKAYHILPMDVIEIEEQKMYAVGVEDGYPLDDYNILNEPPPYKGPFYVIEDYRQQQYLRADKLSGFIDWVDSLMHCALFDGDSVKITVNALESSGREFLKIIKVDEKRQRIDE